MRFHKKNPFLGCAGGLCSSVYPNLGQTQEDLDIQKSAEIENKYKVFSETGQGWIPFPIGLELPQQTPPADFITQTNQGPVRAGFYNDMEKPDVVAFVLENLHHFYDPATSKPYQKVPTTEAGKVWATFLNKFNIQANYLVAAISTAIEKLTPQQIKEKIAESQKKPLPQPVTTLQFTPSFPEQKQEATSTDQQPQPGQTILPASETMESTSSFGKIFMIAGGIALLFSIVGYTISEYVLPATKKAKGKPMKKSKKAK